MIMPFSFPELEQLTGMQSQLMFITTAAKEVLFVLDMPVVLFPPNSVEEWGPGRTHYIWLLARVNQRYGLHRGTLLVKPFAFPTPMGKMSKEGTFKTTIGPSPPKKFFSSSAVNPQVLQCHHVVCNFHQPQFLKL